MNQSNFEQAYNSLNLEQRSAVDTIEGPVIVNAGPGTGKTQLLALRVANILKISDVPASSILCLTFTESGATNMRQRLTKLIGSEGNRVAIHTFHSFGREVINHNPDYFFSSADFQPIEALQQRQILQTILDNLDALNPLSSYHGEQGFVFQNDILAWISALKKEGLSPEEFDILTTLNQEFLNKINPVWNQVFVAKERITSEHLTKIDTLIETVIHLHQEFVEQLLSLDSIQLVLWQRYNMAKVILAQLEKVKQEMAKSGKTKSLTKWKNDNLKCGSDLVWQHKALVNSIKHRSLAGIYQQYQDILHRQGMFDFDDMLMQVVQVVESPGGLALKYNLQEKYLYILVDEFQDTNGVQLRILQSLLYGGTPNVLVVGDTDQSIYKFQGATVGNLLTFGEFYPSSTVVNLVRNYRSNQQILDLAHSLIEQSSIRSQTNKLAAV